MARECRRLAHSIVPCRLTAGGFQLLEAELVGGGVCVYIRRSWRVWTAEYADIADKAHKRRVTPPFCVLRDNPSNADRGGLLRLRRIRRTCRLPLQKPCRDGKLLNIR